MDTLPLNHETWRSGLTLAAYVDQMGKFQAEMRRRLHSVHLNPDDQAFFARLETPLHALALTENWCPDSLMNLPILAAVVAAAPVMDLRVFLRGQNHALTRHYAGRGIRAIPVFAFLTHEFEEIGVWAERPGPAHARVAAWWAAQPEVAALRDQQALTRAEALRLKRAKDSLRSAMTSWYAEGLQSATIGELKALLAPALHTTGEAAS